MKRIIALTLAALLLCGAVFAQASEYCTIAELRQQTPERLTCSYETKRGRIDVDAPIFVPDLQAQPVVRLAKAPLPSLDNAVWPENAQFIVDKKTQAAPWARFTIECNFPNPYLGIDLQKHSVLLKPWNDPIAEDSDMTPSEATILASDLIGKCLANMEFNAFNIVGIQAHSAYYHYDDHREEYLEKLTETGFYSIGARQQFMGATLYNRGNYYWESGRKNGDLYIPTCGIGARIYSEDQYRIIFELFQMLEVIQDDIPLAPWSAVQHTIDQLVENGNIRELISIDYRDLGLFNAPDAPQEYFAAPYWEIQCLWAASGKAKNPVYAEPVAIQLNAQTGALLDPMSTAADRNTCTTLQTWDQVQ